FQNSMHFKNGGLVHSDRDLRENVERKNQIERFWPEWNLRHRSLRDFLKTSLAHPFERVHGDVEALDFVASDGAVVAKIESGAASGIKDAKVWGLKFAGSYRIGDLPHGDKPPVVFFELI